jgi:hypothetical protein
VVIARVGSGFLGLASLSGVPASQDFEPGSDDDRLLALLVDLTDETSATVTRSWADGPGVWDVRVEPGDPDAAPIEAWVDDNFLFLRIAGTHTEVRGQPDYRWGFMERVVEAVVAGRIEEVGLRDNGRIRPRLATVR